MSTLQTTNLKHPDAADNQITFTSGGDVNFDNGAVYLDSANNRLGLGTSSPNYQLHVTTDFAVGASGFNQQLTFSNDTIQSLLLGTGYTTLKLNPLGGNVGIGTTSPTTALDVRGSTEAAIRIGTPSTFYGTLFADTSLTTLNSYNNNPLAFSVSTGNGFSEKVRVDTSGRLLVGSISASTLAGGVQSHTAGVVGTTTTLDLANGAPGFFSQLAGNNDADQVVGVWFNHGGLNAGIGTSRSVTNQWGTDLRFYTHKSTASDQYEVYERLRIYPDGGMRHGAMISNTTNGAGEFFSSGGFISIQNLTFSTTAHCFQVKTGNPTMTTRMVIRNDGDLENANNHYDAYSDASMKENIVDANSQWDDIKALRVRNYNFKEETGHSTHRQIGVIAQEVEATSPGLVSDRPVTDAEGNPTDETYKTVSYSVLNVKAVKALQEAMERIETLEQRLNDAGIA